jgi:hypothetical protein
VYLHESDAFAVELVALQRFLLLPADLAAVGFGHLLDLVVPALFGFEEDCLFDCHALGNLLLEGS